jgi:mRNA interferase RelE/StbE
MKAIAYTGVAARQRAKLDSKIRARIDAKLETYAASGHGDLKRLAGREGVRLRMGDWRVIFYEEVDTIVVTAVGHRREIYD